MYEEMVSTAYEQVKLNRLVSQTIIIRFYLCKKYFKIPGVVKGRF
jgi:hypothetical protein